MPAGIRNIATKLAARVRLVKMRKGQQRVRLAAFDDDEHGQQDHARRQARERAGVAPAVFGVAGSGEAVDDAKQSEAPGERAGDVQGAGVTLGLTEHPRCHECGDQADRHVDEEGQTPAVDEHAAQVEARAGEPATEDQADRRARAGHGGVHRERAVARWAGGEGGGDQRQRGGRGHRGAQALKCASGEQQRLALRQAAEQRGDGEDDEADHEDPATAVEVTEAAAEKQQAAEGQGVPGDNPGQSGVGEAEVLLDVGQRDVGDRGIEHHHQLRHGDEREGPPEVGAVPALGLGLGNSGHEDFLVSSAGKISSSRTRAIAARSGSSAKRKKR